MEGAAYRRYALYKRIVVRRKGSIIQKNGKGTSSNRKATSTVL